jgi:hypothetical protein
MDPTVEIPLPIPETIGPSRPRRRPQRWMALTALIIIAASALFFTTWPHYAGTSVCQICGIRRDYFDWDSRFFHFTIHRFKTDHPTAVSRALASRSPLPAHRHDWSALSSPIAPKESDEIPPNLLYAVEAPRVASFLREVTLYATDGALEKWKAITLEPQFSTELEPSLRFLRFPENGFADPAAFKQWWQRSEFALWNRLRERTEPD